MKQLFIYLFFPFISNRFSEHHENESCNKEVSIVDKKKILNDNFINTLYRSIIIIIINSIKNVRYIIFPLEIGNCA